MENYSVTQGVALSISVRLLDDQGDPITSYAGTEPLTARIWPGDNLPSTLTASAAWVSGPAGSLTILVTPGQTAGLAEGRYRGSLELTDPTLGVLEAYAWSMDILPAPGSATLGLPYCKFRDLLRLGRGWLRQLQSDDDVAGFAEQIDSASRWLDDLIIARYPINSVALLGDAGYGALAYGNAGALPNQWLRGVLAGGGLILREKGVNAVAKKALSEVCKGQVGVGTQSVDYRTLGRIYESEASAEAMTLTAEICTDGSGVPNFGIPLGYTATRAIYGG